MLRIVHIVPAVFLGIGLVSTGCDAVPDARTGPRGAASQQPQPTHSESAPLRPPFQMADFAGTVHEPLIGDGPAAFFFILGDCPIANSYAPEIRRIHETYSARGVRCYVVHIDPDYTADDARRHAREFDLPEPVLFDPEHHLVRQAGIEKVPEAAVFSPDGNLLYRGRIDDRYAAFGRQRIEPQRCDLRNALNALLAGETVPGPTGATVGCDVPTLASGGRESPD